jgi:hypothetical protein
MKRIVLALAALLLVPSFASAQPVDAQANLNVLITPFDNSFCDGPFGYIDEGSCADLTGPAGAGDLPFLWLVVSHQGGFNGTPPGGIGGAEFGVEYDASISNEGWFLCTGGLEAPDAEWPASGSGNAVTWANGCYIPTGSAARIGFFVLTDATGGPIGLVQHASIGKSLWVDCGVPPTVPPQEFEICFNPGATSWPKANHGGDQDVSDGTGTERVCDDNCAIIPVKETSWGQIKALF